MSPNPSPPPHSQGLPPLKTPSPNIRDLDRSLIYGIAWTGFAKWMIQIISWVATPIVARLLTPADYGLAGMAMVFIGFVQLISEFGLAAAIVQRRELTDDQIARLGGVSVLLGAFFVLFTIAVASPVARFFGNPEVARLVVVLSVIFLTSSFQALPRALLTRDLNFRRLAVLDGIDALIQIATTLLLAALGFRYWALVIGGILGRVASMIPALLWRGHRLQWPTPLKSIADPLVFGAHIVVASIAWYIFRNADLTIIGRKLGSVALGNYTMASTLASIPVDRVGAFVVRATPAVFATVQNDHAALRRYVLAVTEGLALLTFPVAVGLALVADEFVHVVLGESWHAAIIPLRLLALAAVFRSVVTVLNQVLVATGASKRSMQATLAISIVLPPVFYFASEWGTGGVAMVWLVAYPVIASAFFVRHAFAACELTLKPYLKALWPAVSATLAMVSAVLAVELIVPDECPVALLLGAKCAAGAAAYSGVIWRAHGRRVRSFFALVRAPQREDSSLFEARNATPGTPQSSGTADSAK